MFLSRSTHLDVFCKARPCNSSTQSSLPSTYVALDASDFEKAVSGD